MSAPRLLKGWEVEWCSVMNAPVLDLSPARSLVERDEEIDDYLRDLTGNQLGVTFRLRCSCSVRIVDQYYPWGHGGMRYVWKLARQCDAHLEASEACENDNRRVTGWAKPTERIV